MSRRAPPTSRGIVPVHDQPPSPVAEAPKAPKREKRAAGVARRPPSQVVKKKKKCVWISSFGRRQNKKGALYFGQVTARGYRGHMEIKLKRGKYTPQVHTMVQVLHNDPELLAYHAFHAEYGEYPTTDHINPAFAMKSENHRSGLKWATKKEQIANRILTTEGGASKAMKQSVGRVQFREDGTEWNDDNICVSQSAAARATGQSQGAIGEWLGDGKVHIHKASGKSFEYRTRPFEVEEGFEGEQWFSYAPLPDMRFSDRGRLREGNRIPWKGTKIGAYRVFTYNGLSYMVHEFLGRINFGEPPSLEHTIDHDRKELDEEGCLSNAVSNLIGWADRSEQNATARNGSYAESGGKPMLVTDLKTGRTHRYTDSMTAGRAHGVPPVYMSQRASGLCKQDGELLIKWEPQPDLVRANTTIVDGQVKLNLEVETWKKIDPSDFEPGGKYHILVVNAREYAKRVKKRDLSKGIEKKRRKGSNNHEASTSSAAP